MNIEINHVRVDKSIIERLLDFLPYPFLISEFRDGTYYNFFINHKFREEIGYTVDDIPTIDDWFRVAYPDPAYREHVRAGWNERAVHAGNEGKDSIQMQVRINTRSLGERWYEVKSSLSGNVQLVAFVSIHEEISREEELERLNENKNRTLSILAHDLRVPIANLQSLSQLLLSGRMAQQEFIDCVRQVNEKSLHLLEFIDTTLAWTKSNFDTIQMNPEPVDLKSITGNILAIYENSYRSKRISVSIGLVDHAPVTDAQIVTILVRNLISNAIKFTPADGFIFISSRHENGEFIISVRDTGIGMSDEVIARITSDSYFSGTGTRQEKGLGIGLRLCRQLLKKIHGRMEISSEYGKGTTISLVLQNS